MIPSSLLDKPVSKEDGDYTKDGLVYCHLCNTPKQLEINFMGVKRIVTCMCKHREEEYRQACKEEARIAHEKYISYLRQTAFHSPMMFDWTFANAKSCKTITTAKNYADNFETFSRQSKGLLFFGDVGNGKSYASACICNALIDKGVKVLMSNLARLTNELQADFDHRQDYIDNLDNYKLLVIDDLGIERDTGYMAEQVFSIFDARYQSGLPLIVTTNLTWEQLKNPKGDRGNFDLSKKRVYDRILERCHPVEVKGESMRKIKLEKGFSKMQSILEGKA